MAWVQQQVAKSSTFILVARGARRAGSRSWAAKQQSAAQVVSGAWSQSNLVVSSRQAQWRQAPLLGFACAECAAFTRLRKPRGVGARIPAAHRALVWRSDTSPLKPFSGAPTLNHGEGRVSWSYAREGETCLCEQGAEFVCRTLFA